MHDEVKKRVEDGDIRGLQYVFVNCLDVDPTFEKYKEDFEYCCKNMPQMFERHADLTTHIDNNQTNWTNDYWNGLKVDLLKNFSKERFEHMRNVAKVVYASKILRLKQERELEVARRELEQENKCFEEEMRKKHINQNMENQERIKEQKRKQNEELAAARRELEEGNRCFEESQQRRQKNQRDNQSYSRASVQSSGNEIKKVVGTVLIIVVLLLIVLVLIRVVKN